MLGKYFVTVKDLKEHIDDLSDDSLVCIRIKGQVPLLLEAVAEVTNKDGLKTVYMLHGFEDNELELIA